MKWLTRQAPRVTLESHYGEQFVFKQLLTMFRLISVLTVVSLDVFFLRGSANSLMTFSFAANVGLRPGREQNIAGRELELCETPAEAAIVGTFLLCSLNLKIRLKNRLGVTPLALTFNCVFKLQQALECAFASSSFTVDGFCLKFRRLFVELYGFFLALSPLHIMNN